MQLTIRRVIFENLNSDTLFNNNHTFTLSRKVTR